MAAAYPDLPQTIRSFLSYISNIEGKSAKTVHEYYYDLRTFFRFMKCSRGLADFSELDELDCSDITDDFIRSITLDDIYEFLTYTNKIRDNSPISRARKVSSLKSCFNYLSTKARIVDVNITNNSNVKLSKETEPGKDFSLSLVRYLRWENGGNVYE